MGWKIERLRDLTDVDMTGEATGDVPTLQADGSFTMEAAGGSVSVEDDGTEVVAEASTLDFGTGLSVTDNGSGDVTIDLSATGDGAYAETIGDGSTTSFAVTHNLGTEDVHVQVWDVSGADPVLANSDPSSITATDSDTVTVVFGSAPTTDQYRVVVLASGATGGSGAGLTTYGQPVSGRRLRMARVENQAVAASTSYTLASLSGPGVITGIWMALVGSSGALAYDGILRVYYDGEATPSFEASIADLTASTFVGPVDARYASNRVQLEHRTANNWLGFHLGFEVPFRTSVEVEYHNPSSDTGTLFAQVFWSDGESRAYRLKSNAVSYLNRVTVTSGATHSLLSLASGTSGWLVFSSVFGDGVSNRTFLERDVEVSIDGEASPSIASTGLEDWFLGSFYFQDRKFYGTPTTLVGENDTTNHRTGAAIDLLEAHGGIRFEDGIDVVLGTEAAVTTDHDMAYAMLWYEDV